MFYSFCSFVWCVLENHTFSGAKLQKKVCSLALLPGFLPDSVVFPREMYPVDVQKMPFPIFCMHFPVLDGSVMEERMLTGVIFVWP